MSAIVKELIAGLLGFFTLPIAGLLIWGIASFGAKLTELIYSFGLEPAHYWAGLVLSIALAVVAACVAAFIR